MVYDHEQSHWMICGYPSSMESSKPRWAVLRFQLPIELAADSPTLTVPGGGGWSSQDVSTLGTPWCTKWADWVYLRCTAFNQKKSIGLRSAWHGLLTCMKKTQQPLSPIGVSPIVRQHWRGGARNTSGLNPALEGEKFGVWWCFGPFIYSYHSSFLRWDLKVEAISRDVLCFLHPVDSDWFIEGSS